MTNEERREKENLLLMCHRHHIQTDNVAQFSVEVMREIKRAHEDRFSEALGQIAKSAIEDHTRELTLTLPVSLKRMNRVLEMGNSEEELLGTIEETIRPGLEDFGVVPAETRSIFLSIVERGFPHGRDLQCPVHELKHALRIDEVDLNLHLSTLDRYGFVWVDRDTNGEEPPYVETIPMNGWEFWRFLKKFSSATQIPLRDFIMDLRFDRLD